jgi:hypothetical protein
MGARPESVHRPLAQRRQQFGRLLHETSFTFPPAACARSIFASGNTGHHLGANRHSSTITRCPPWLIVIFPNVLNYTISDLSILGEGVLKNQTATSLLSNG